MHLRQHNGPRVSAAKAAFSTATAYRIENDPQLPSTKKKPRGRRRPDPLAGIFDEEIVPMLEQAPDLRSVGIFEELIRRHPELGGGVRRTLDAVCASGALHGPERELVFRQTHPPGQLGLSDFTDPYSSPISFPPIQDGLTRHGVSLPEVLPPLRFHAISNHILISAGGHRSAI